MAKILLVEDDNNLREIYEARLKAEGYEVFSAHDGEEALVTAKAQMPDLVISDVMMPKISGFEMLDILRNTDGLRNLKVIMLTALGQSEDQERAQKLGSDKYLVKSQVTLEDIVNAAKELLESKVPVDLNSETNNTENTSSVPSQGQNQVSPNPTNPEPSAVPVSTELNPAQNNTNYHDEVVTPSQDPSIETQSLNEQNNNQLISNALDSINNYAGADVQPEPSFEQAQSSEPETQGAEEELTSAETSNQEEQDVNQKINQFEQSDIQSSQGTEVGFDVQNNYENPDSQAQPQPYPNQSPEDNVPRSNPAVAEFTVQPNPQQSANNISGISDDSAVDPSSITV